MSERSRAAGLLRTRKSDAGVILASRLPPHALFMAGAISQYIGSSFAVKLFADVAASGVAWLRVLSAAVVLVAWRRPWRTAWTARRVRLVAAFGVTLAVMNLAFYLAIARLPLGTAVAIEFSGPIAVAALGSRTRRDAAALALAVAGVLLLADVHLQGAPAGAPFPRAGARSWRSAAGLSPRRWRRSQELASERQSRDNLVCLEFRRVLFRSRWSPYH